MRGKRYCLTLLALVALLACSPAATPAPAPVPVAPTPATPAALTPATPSLSPEEAAWARVVEAAKREGKVTAYSFHFIGDVGTGIASAFRQKYGIELEFTSGPGSLLMERIRSEQRAGQATADLLTTATTLVVLSKNDGLTQPAGELPVLQEKGVWFGGPKLDEAGHVIGMAVGSYIPVVNTNLVKSGEEPRTWRELVEPRWKGKIVLGDPSIIPGPVTVYWALTSRGKLSRDYFVQLGRQDPKIVSTTRENVAAVARGEGSVSWGNAEAQASPFVAEGAPLKAVDMAEGIPVEISSAIAMVKNAPHPNAARVFMNWFLSQEGQAAYAKLDQRLSIRKDVPDLRPAPLRIQFKEPLPFTIQDSEAVARIMREKELYNIIYGK